MKKIKYSFLGMMLGMLILFTACEKEEIMTYDVQRSALDFIGSGTEYTFLGNPDDEYIMEIDVRIVGDTANYDRNFNVAIIDTLTTAQPDQYEIIGGVVKAGEFEGKLSVKLFNSEMLKDTTLNIGFKIVDSEDFLSGNIEKNDFVLGFTDKVVVPSWRFIRFFFCATQSTECYRIFVLTTGLTEFGIKEYIASGGPTGARALGTKFGDYIKEWNKNNPDNQLRHDDGDKAGELIIPKYYTRSKYD